MTMCDCNQGRMPCTCKIAATFRIKWRDPDDNEVKELTQEFAGCSDISPKEWAEDYAYALADKGWYEITEIPDRR